jgi:phospholipid-binding lipoprotein MlaA
VDFAANPLTWITGNEAFDAATNTRIVLQGLDTREGLIEPLDSLRRGSLDPYAALRSAYRQRRAAEIGNALGGSPAARGTGFGVGAGFEGLGR